MKGEDVLFVGLGASAVTWYRCALPAMFMGADWIGVAGAPGDEHFSVRTGMRRRDDLADYKTVVLQQPAGQKWLDVIVRLQERGIRVLFEVDDYLHAIHKMKDHDFRQGFSKARLRELELCMRRCDGVICSTEYIARRYRAFNKRTFVCENGVDASRYALTRPPRPTVNFGWAGATGHVKAAVPWFREVARLMHERERVCFVSVGQNFADAMKPRFGQRAVSIPWTAIDVYPAAMTMFDVALAPAGRNAFFQGKSDLRWVEAGALGIPTVADPRVYPNIEHGVTGFHADSPSAARELMTELVDDDKLRLQTGANAREMVLERRDMKIAVRAWEDVIEEVLDG